MRKRLGPCRGLGRRLHALDLLEAQSENVADLLADMARRVHIEGRELEAPKDLCNISAISPKALKSVTVAR